MAGMHIGYHTFYFIAGADTGGSTWHQHCGGTPAGGCGAEEEGQFGPQPVHGQAQLQKLTRLLSGLHRVFKKTKPK